MVAMKIRIVRRFVAFLMAILLLGGNSSFLSKLFTVTADEPKPAGELQKTLVEPVAPAKSPEPSQETFMGLQPGLGSLPLLGQGRTRSISAENPTGGKGKGGMAVPNPSEQKPVASGRAADDLGQGWKVRPFIRLNARETAVLMDVAGPGIIQPRSHIGTRLNPMPRFPNCHPLPSAFAWPNCRRPA